LKAKTKNSANSVKIGVEKMSLLWVCQALKPDHMLALTEKPLFKPKEEKLWPGEENPAWHRKERYRR